MNWLWEWLVFLIVFIPMTAFVGYLIWLDDDHNEDLDN